VCHFQWPILVAGLAVPEIALEVSVGVDFGISIVGYMFHAVLQMRLWPIEPILMSGHVDVLEERNVFLMAVEFEMEVQLWTIQSFK